MKKICFLIFFLTILFMPEVLLSQQGFSSVAGSAGNVNHYMGQPFFSQFENATGAVSEGVAQAYLIRTEITDNMCQYDSYNQYGFNIPAQDSLVEIDSMKYSFTAQFNYDSITQLVVTVRPVYHIYDTLLYYADNMEDHQLGDDTLNYFTQYGCDSITYLMVYAVECSQDTIVTAPYSVSEIAINPNAPIVLPLPNNVSITSNQPALFPAGETTDVNWNIAVADKSVICNQQVMVLLPPCGDDFTATDIQNNVYSTVRLGYDCWIRENMRANQYSNSGADVPVALVYDATMHHDIQYNLNTYGRLYSWNSAVGVPENSTALPIADENGHIQGICPNGWHIPTETNLASLMSYHANDLKSTDLWIAPGTDASHFTSRPAGMYEGNLHRFVNLLGNTYYWSDTNANNTDAINAHLSYFCEEILIMSMEKDNALSVRCLKD